MVEYLKKEANTTVTENGAATHITTESDCLDLFATIGALRHASDTEIENRFVRAFMENKDLATKLLFFARDIRGGLGERRVFRTILRWLANNAPDTVRKNLPYVAEYGRYDDLLSLINTPCEKDAAAILKTQFQNDMEHLKNGEAVSLLGKWLPSVNTSNPESVANGKKIARYFGMRNEEYRKALTALRKEIKIIENNLREKDYTFDYEKCPSKAMYRYRRAFLRNDGERYSEFLERVNRGEAKMHAEVLYPYELVASCLDPFDRIRKIDKNEETVLNTTWNALTAFDTEENMLAVIDTSGSMYSGTYHPEPAAVALSLGLYCAEHNHGVFHNHFIEFSATPRLIEIKGDTFVDRLRYLSTFNEIANTNLAAVFDLILDTAVKYELPASELPTKLIIISDMEFDYCIYNADLTNFDYAKKKFESNGYRLPDIVFWNVDSRNTHQPVTMNEEGVALVSGCTPRLFSMVTGDLASPYDLMMETLSSDRYKVICA